MNTYGLIIVNNIIIFVLLFTRIALVNSKIIHIIGAQFYEEFGIKIPS